MGRLVDTADINNVFMYEKSNYGIFAVEIDHIISGIVSKCPAIEPKPETVTEFADRCRECGARYGKLVRKWIPVSERLPNDGTWNLFTDGKNVSVERYKVDALNHFFPNGRWFSLEEAVAWMPLPEPYEPHESEEV